jgi:hypothetical protein
MGIRTKHGFTLSGGRGLYFFELPTTCAGAPTRVRLLGDYFTVLTGSELSGEGIGRGRQCARGKVEWFAAPPESVRAAAEEGFAALFG